MLAGLAAQSLTLDTAQTLSAFTTVALVFVALLVTASISASLASIESLRPVRTAGPAVKKWSGYVLVAAGAWFLVLATLPDPVFGG